MGACSQSLGANLSCLPGMIRLSVSEELLGVGGKLEVLVPSCMLASCCLRDKTLHSYTSALTEKTSGIVKIWT